MEVWLVKYETWDYEGGSCTILGIFSEYEKAKQRAKWYWNNKVFVNFGATEQESNLDYYIGIINDGSGNCCSATLIWLDEEIEE